MSATAVLGRARPGVMRPGATDSQSAPPPIVSPGTAVDVTVYLRTQTASVIIRNVGANVTVSQDYSAAKTWTSDWSLELAQPKLSGVTISSATATCATSGVTVGTATVTDSGTSVTFKVSQSGITVPTPVEVVVAVTLSNGDTDQRNFGIQFTDT